MITSQKSPGRNDPCPCESGLKYKNCHGDEMKRQVCNQVAREKMLELILEERERRGVGEFKYTCANCSKKTNKPEFSELAPTIPKCPACGDTRLTEKEGAKEEQKSEVITNG